MTGVVAGGSLVHRALEAIIGRPESSLSLGILSPGTIVRLLPRGEVGGKTLRLQGEVHGIHLKEKGRTYEQSFKGAWGRLRYRMALDEGQRKKRAMFRAYARLARVVPLNIPYVYVGLHFQPERTTSSLGGVFADQYLLVDMLARNVPLGWMVYVKEHPSQFYPPFAGERSRHPDFYTELLSLPNVELVDLQMSSFDLIDRARAVATVAGTVGWEAVVRERPALMFGSGWYRYCEGVFHVPTETALRAALARIEAGYRPDPRRVRLFLQALDLVSARAGLGYATPDERELNLSVEESAQRLALALRRCWRRMCDGQDSDRLPIVAASTSAVQEP